MKFSYLKHLFLFFFITGVLALGGVFSSESQTSPFITYPISDGYVMYLGASSSSWDSAHNASQGTSLATVLEDSRAEVIATDFIARGFFVFDTSALPDDAVISSVRLYLRVFNTLNGDNDGNDFIVVTPSTQAGNGDVILDDFDQAGALTNPAELSNRIDITGISAAQYQFWTLNATGITAINKTGFTKLALREGHDVLNDPPQGSSSRIKYYSLERAGVSEDPYLKIIYTAPPSSSDTQAPATPANLTATPISSSQINLSWTASTDNVGVTGYRIYRGGSQITTTAQTAYSDTALTASTAYTYTISAYDTAGNVSSQTSGVSATTQSATPPPSSGLLWSTTYNCADWNANKGLNPNTQCDSLSAWGGWTTNTGKNEEITAAANNPAGGGGKGQRHWATYFYTPSSSSTNLCTDRNYASNTSGGTRYVFPSTTPELWIRFYMKYEAGIMWTPLIADKWLYFDPGLPHAVVPEWYSSDRVNMWVNGSGNHSSADGNGWNAVMANGPLDPQGNRISDGQWHPFEVHMKMDTNGANGVGEIWINGVKRFSSNTIDYKTAPGWTTLVFGSNKGCLTKNVTQPNDMAIDYDDIAISTTGYIGPLGSVSPPPSDTQAPTIPTGLTATTISSSQINLSWTASTDNVGVTGYRIYRGGSQITTTTQTSYQDTGLSAGTSYTYTIAAYDTAGNVSSQTSGVSATTQSATPPPSSGLLWSTTYNCNDWDQGMGLLKSNVNCDNLVGYGNWTTASGSKEQITAAANNPAGGGGKGQRHWLGDGSASNSGGTSLSLASPKEFWMRWYMRFEKDFEWSSLSNYKTLYFDLGQQDATTIQFKSFDLLNFWVVFSGAPNYSSPSGNGWNTIMANGALDANSNRRSDGQWHAYEIHMKMDTNGSDGVAEMWVDGVKRFSYANVNYNAQPGWDNVIIGSNHAFSLNGTDRYVDYDDFAISTAGYVGLLGSAPPPSSDTQAPTTPANLAATAQSSSQINLSWTASTDNVGVTGYRIYRGGSQIASTAQTSYQDTGLSAGMSYTYTITAYDAAGNVSSQTSGVSATTQASVPTTVTNVRFTVRLEGTANASNRDVTLTVLNAGDTTQVAQFTARTDTSGNIALPSGITLLSGRYDILVFSQTYLRRRAANATISSNATIVLPLLPAGDLNSDNTVNSLDWSLMIPKWFTADTAADANRDGFVNALDFSLLSRNWASVGD